MSSATVIPQDAKNRDLRHVDGYSDLGSAIATNSGHPAGNNGSSHPAGNGNHPNKDRQSNSLLFLLRAMGAMFTAAFLWGTAFLFVRIALTGYAPQSITFIRCFIGAIVVGSVVLMRQRAAKKRYAKALEEQSALRITGDTTNVPLRHQTIASPQGAESAMKIASRQIEAIPELGDPPRRLALKTWERTAGISVIIAGVFTACAFLGIAVGEKSVSSSITGIILGTVPVWTAAMTAAKARILRRSSSLSASLYVALVLGMLAAVLPVLGKDTSATAVGVAVLLGAAFSHAFSMIAVQTGVDRFGPIANTGFVTIVATIALAPAGLLAINQGDANLYATLALIELGVLPTGVAYIAFFRAVSMLGAARATVAIYMIPAVAVATGALVAGEHISIMAILGALCAFTAIALSVIGTRAASR